MAKQGSRHEVAKECIRKEENGSVKMFSLFFLCIFHVTKRILCDEKGCGNKWALRRDASHCS
ncbi:hypothetical protein LEMLEM_LOCUS10131 [Lemmus lemmus]